MKENEHKKSGVYGVIGAIALILIGGIFGFIINGTTRINHSNMSKGDCGEIANRILSAARNNQPQLIEQLNKVYSENCLDREFEQPKPEPKSEEKKMPETTCGQIEMLLLDRLMPNNSQSPEDHIDNAKIYANLSERGCPENSLKYRDLAAKELEIARALNDDNVARDPDESIEIVETYKRLQMQQEAARMIEKAKKLTNPAIDFIIELEKIIEE
ncbi:MAG: hypothetical protein IJQ55_03600 [Alphaproteobacteria bacterium]|nr:hypothetical protein [Alphaproteobacteria bacterium]